MLTTNPERVQEMLTDAAYKWVLTQPKLLDWIQKKIGCVTSGQIRLTKVEVERDGDVETVDTSSSYALRSFVADRLYASFGPESGTDFDELSYVGGLALTASLCLDWGSLANKLLRHLTLDYIPGESTLDI